MKRLIGILADKKGDVLVQTAGIVFFVMFFFSIAFTYGSSLIITGGVRDTVRNAVISAVNANYVKAYDGIREGNSDAYDADNSWESSADLGNVELNVAEFLGLTDDNNAYTKLNNGQEQYAISDIQAILQNPPFLSNSSTLNIKITYTLNLPISIFLVRVSAINIPQSVNAQFEQKF
jgi:hypothetical protein